MSNFAKQQLLKYGWTEGKGLGKNETGIAEVLRLKLKFNNEGLGYNSLSNTEWWQTSFDNASKNIVVDKQNDEISFSVVNKNSTANKVAEVMLKSKESRLEMYNNSRKLKMTNFIKPATGQKIENVEKEEKEASREIPVLTDDELFKACKGRTGHTGARHGITMSGKLERIHQHEKRLLHLMKRLSLKNATKTATEMDGNAAKLNSNNNNNNTNVAIITMDESSSKENDFRIFKSKATIKREKKNMQNLTRMLNVKCNISNSTSSSNITKIKKSSRRKNKKSKNKKCKTQSISEIITSPKEKHDLVDSNQLQMRDKTYKKRRKHRAVVNQKKTPVGNINRNTVVDKRFNLEDLCKLEEYANINPKNVDLFPRNFLHPLKIARRMFRAKLIIQKREDKIKRND